MSVAPGQIVTVSIAGSTPNFSFLGQSGANVQSAILAEINASGWATVVSQAWTPSSVQGLIGALDLFAAPFTASLSIQISAASAPVEKTDVETLVAQAVLDNTGYTATVSSTVNAGGGAAPDPLAWLYQAFPWLQSLGTFAIVAIMALVALLIYTVGPHTKVSV